MNKTIAKLVFIVESTFSARDYNRFGVDVLIKNGFEVDVLDLTPYLKPEFFDKNSILPASKLKNYISISSEVEFDFELSKYKSDSFVMSIITYRVDTYNIYKIISKFKIPFGLLSSGTVPYKSHINDNKILFKKIVNRVANLNYSVIVSYLINYLPNYLLGINSAKYCFVGGGLSSTKMKLIGRETEIVWIHTLDYDNYLEDSTEPMKQSDFAVFLDQNLPFHSDFVHAGHFNPFVPNEYYSELNKAFEQVEKNYNLKIVISAHPRANREILSKHFKGRDVCIGDTANLVKDSKLCIAHWSHSVNYAVLYRKPVIFLTSDMMEKYGFGEYISSYASCFNKKVINISKDFSLYDKNDLYVDSSLYQKYINDFVKSDNSCNGKYWDIVSEKIRAI